MDLYKRILCFVFLFILTITTGIAVAQTGKDTSTQEIIVPADSSGLPPEEDTNRINAIKEQIRKRFEDSVSAESDTIVPILVQKIQSITELIGTANRITGKGFDTIAISRNLPLTENLLSIIEMNFISRNAYQNLRALKSTKAILIQSEAQLESWQNTLFHYADELANLKVKLAEVRKDPVLRKLPSDSMLRDIYFGQIAGLLIRWKMVDSAINMSMLQLGVLENRVASSFLKTRDFLDKTNYKLTKYIEGLWRPEEPWLFKARRTDYDVSFGEAYTSSMVSVGRIIVYYADLNTSSIVIAVIIILLLYGWLMRVFYTFKMKSPLSGLQTSSELVLKYPLLKVTGLVLTLIAIFFFNLPPSWNWVIWMLIGIMFFIISRLSEKTKKLFRPEFFIVFLLFNNLSVLIKNSLGERWIGFMLDLLTTGYAVYMIREMRAKKIELSLLAKRLFFAFAAFSALALITNLYGSFMLSKVLNNGAVYAIVAAIVLSICSDIIVRIIFLHEEAFKGSRFISYFNLYKLEKAIRQLLYVGAVVAWVMIMIQQLNLFDYAYEWVLEFLSNERKLGSHSFTFGSILVFILILCVSAFLSRLLMIFFGDATNNNTSKQKKWMGSVLLLTRLGIFTVGILIAFFASGIPMDKLTIIIGALGVGIGFGLQNIVNNLVSGVILAFERPVQVGDAIEVGNRYGVIKEIGIRASKLTTVEGSEVIVPNGDMLSQHIINWTLSSNYRRVEVIVGVSYKTDLRIAEKILNEIIRAEKGIQSYPAPVVLAHNFNNSSIDFRLLFWCHIDTWINVKSEVMMDIHKSFNEHGIEIPFPQRDINIRGVENLLHNEGKKEEDEELDPVL